MSALMSPVLQRSERYLMSVEFDARALSACRVGKMSQSKWRKPRIKKSQSFSGPHKLLIAGVCLGSQRSRLRDQKRQQPREVLS
jgi:hypothetical protein